MCAAWITEDVGSEPLSGEGSAPKNTSLMLGDFLNLLRTCLVSSCMELARIPDGTFFCTSSGGTLAFNRAIPARRRHIAQTHPL